MTKRADSARRHPRAERRGEARLPAVVAVVVAVALYAALPGDLLFGSRYVVPALEALLLAPLILVNPWRMTRETQWSRNVALLLVFLIVGANLGSLGLLMRALLAAKISDGRQLLRAALQVWVTNIIAFGLGYWELDRGGPISRTQVSREDLPPADFRFSQDENDDAITEVSVGSSAKADWVPTFLDYLYVSVTNSTAFSPTDTMPLTPRAKLLMAIQAIASLLMSVLVISRGVSLLQ